MPIRRILPHGIPATLTDTQTRRNIPAPYQLYDASYLANEALWDSYAFTTIPQVADDYNDLDEEDTTPDLFASLLRGDKLLPNPRFMPYEPLESSFKMAALQANAVVRYNAGHILVHGALKLEVCDCYIAGAPIVSPLTNSVLVRLCRRSSLLIATLCAHLVMRRAQDTVS